MRVLIFLLFSVSMFAADLQLKSVNDGVQLFHASGKKKLRVSLEKTKKTSKKKIKIYKKDISKFTRLKKQMLKFFGIKEWKLENKDWVKIGKSEAMVLKGSYLNSSGEKIFFIETHLFNEHETVQVLASNTDNIPDFSYVESALKKSGVIE